MKKIFLFIVTFFSLQTMMSQNTLIPKPQQLTLENGSFNFGKTIRVQADKKNPEIQYLAKELKAVTPFSLEYVKGNPNLRFAFLKKTGQKEGYYQLSVDKEGILISAPDNQGLLYGIQTLMQMIEEHQSNATLPYLKIVDFPKFDYRGMHLDVVRHFFTVDQVKNYLDYMAAYKYNKFHWHLTDDQGWRIQIKKYPKLTSVGAWRPGSQIGPYSDMKFDTIRYGGFYTQDQIKEVVAYARKLHIDVIPEIEMPGHAQAAIAAYPELGCTDQKLTPWTQWGVSENIFCPTEATFTFLENVLDEVIKLFPYNYIHIGGDEAPKVQWKKSQFCQDLMKKLGLKDEDQLQSYFITRIENYLNSKGRKIIGWNEILEGGLAPNATVMSWVGIQGGIEAAQSGHKAIMTPGDTNYFDHYQGNPSMEPLAFGGYTPLSKVYGYNPIPKVLTSEQAKFIWGTQANLWTEYIPDFKQVQYMIFPRMMALAEVAWGTSDPAHYKDFENRVIAQFPVLQKKGINYSRAIFEVSGKILNKDGQIQYQLSAANDKDKIHYTLDGSEPTINSTIYTSPIPVDQSMTIRAAYFDQGKKTSPTTSQDFDFSKSTGKKIVLEFPADESYKGDGPQTLVDGVRGDVNNFGQSWLGFKGNNAVATIDLGTPMVFSDVQFKSIDRAGSWIYLPKGAQVLVSNDGVNYTPVASVTAEQITKMKGKVDVSFGTQQARYVKVVIENLGKIPDGLPGAGNVAWLFVDEISVN